MIKAFMTVMVTCWRISVEKCHWNLIYLVHFFSDGITKTKSVGGISAYSLSRWTMVVYEYEQEVLIFLSISLIICSIVTHAKAKTRQVWCFKRVFASFQQRPFGQTLNNIAITEHECIKRLFENAKIMNAPARQRLQWDRLHGSLHVIHLLWSFCSGYWSMFSRMWS